MRPCAGTISKASSGTGIDCEFNFLSCGAWPVLIATVFLCNIYNPLLLNKIRARVGTDIVCEPPLLNHPPPGNSP